MVISTEAYEKAKIAFLQGHKNWYIDTNPMDSDGVYRKQYVCEDGAIWFEVNGPVYEKTTVRVTVHGQELAWVETIKLFRTEGWSTESSTSVMCYEKF